MSVYRVLIAIFNYSEHQKRTNSVIIQKKWLKTVNIKNIICTFVTEYFKVDVLFCQHTPIYIIIYIIIY
jgi:hypothetical protein